MIKISVLTENTCKEGFISEHGLSLLIESNGKTILFDSGQSDVFLKNSKKLNKDLNAVNLMVLSHGHFDHGGGIPFFIKENNKAPIYMEKEAFGNHYAKRPNKYEYIGLPPKLKGNERIRFTETEERIDSNTILFSGIPEIFEKPRSNEGLYIKNSNGTLIPDKFNHEQNLLIKDSETGKTLLVTGCSHNGILNIVSHFYKTYGYYPNTVIGGFHLSSRSGGDASDTEIEEIGKALLATGSMYYTGHCTGEGPYKKLKNIMGKNIAYIHAGSVCVL